MTATVGGTHGVSGRETVPRTGRRGGRSGVDGRTCGCRREDVPSVDPQGRTMEECELSQRRNF